MKQYFLDLYDYHDKANALVIAALYPKNPAISEYDYNMLQHIVMAHHIWSRRMLKLGYEYDFKAELNQEQIEQLILKNKNELNTIMDQYDLEDKITFANLAGEQYTMKIIDILSHVSHHYAYHRGQIARTIRECGFTPPSTDLMLFRR